MRQKKQAWPVTVFVFSTFIMASSIRQILAQSLESEPCATPLNLVIGGKYRETLIQSVEQNCPELAKVIGIDDLQNSAIIISDTKTGELLWSAGTHKGATLPLSKMNYRVYSGITVVDLNLDGVGDQIIFVDTGGQVWRLFIDHKDSRESSNPIIETLGKNDESGGVMAILSGSASSDRRSFYGRPVVGFIQEGAYNYLTIGIGSGSLVLPQGTTVKDRFYALRTNQIQHTPDVFITPLTENSLVDMTQGKHDAQHKNTMNNGWYIDLPGEGEKIFTEVQLANGYFGFVTYQPSETLTGATGVNRIYTVNAVTGEQNRPITLKNNEPGIRTTLKLVDRRQLGGEQKGAGPVFVLCAERECSVMPGHAIRQTGWLDKRTGQPSEREANSTGHSNK